MIGNWEISHVSESQRFVLYAHAYLNSAQLSCEQMAAHEAQRTWPNATVVLMLAAHSVELFLKGAILGRESHAKVGGHRINLLSEKYRQLYPEPAFASLGVTSLGVKSLIVTSRREDLQACAEDARKDAGLQLWPTQAGLSARRTGSP